MSCITDLQLELLARSLDYLPYDELVAFYPICKTFYQCRSHIQHIVLLYDPGYLIINQIVATFLAVANSVTNVDIYTADPIPLAEIALVFSKTLRQLRVRTNMLSYLKVFLKLQHATLYVTDLSQTHELRNLPSRPTINLVPNDDLEIEHPEHLAQIPNLVALNLSKTRLPDLEFLPSLRYLKEIHLACLLEDLPLDPLSKCIQLTELNVAVRNDDDNIGWISTLVNLTMLSLRHWHSLVNIRPLRHLSKLQYLDLFQCSQLEDVGALSSCRLLLELNLRSTNITDIAILADSCPLLRKLDLRDTPEKNMVNFVHHCAKLSHLKQVYFGRRVADSGSDGSAYNSSEHTAEIGSDQDNDADDNTGVEYFGQGYAF